MCSRGHCWNVSHVGIGCSVHVLPSIRVMGANDAPNVPRFTTLWLVFRFRLVRSALSRPNVHMPQLPNLCHSGMVLNDSKIQNMNIMSANHLKKDYVCCIQSIALIFLCVLITCVYVLNASILLCVYVFCFVLMQEYIYHRQRGSDCTVLTATGLVNGEW